MHTKETLGPTDSQWLGQYSQVHMNVFGTPLRVMDHGEGVRVWDVDGNEYLDFLAIPDLLNLTAKLLKNP